MESRNRNSDPTKQNTSFNCLYLFYFCQVPRLLSLRGINAAGACVLAGVPVVAYVIAIPLALTFVVGSAVGHADGGSR